MSRRKRNIHVVVTPDLSKKIDQVQVQEFAKKVHDQVKASPPEKNPVYIEFKRQMEEVRAK